METYKSKKGTTFELIESDTRRFKINFRYKDYFVEMQFGYDLFIEPRIKVNGEAKVMSYQYNPVAYKSLWKNNLVTIDLKDNKQLIIQVEIPKFLAKITGKGKYKLSYKIGNQSDSIEFDTKSKFIMN